MVRGDNITNIFKVYTDAEYNKLTEDEKQKRANKLYEMLKKADDYLISKVKTDTANTIIEFLDNNVMWQDLSHMTIVQARLFRSHELCENLTEYFGVDDLIEAGELPSDFNDDWDADEEIERDHGKYDNWEV